jgi:hypothetical protein
MHLVCRTKPDYDTLILTVRDFFVVVNLPLTLFFTDSVNVRVHVFALDLVAKFFPLIAQPPLTFHETAAFFAGLIMEVNGTIRFFA